MANSGLRRARYEDVEAVEHPDGESGAAVGEKSFTESECRALHKFVYRSPVPESGLCLKAHMKCHSLGDGNV